MKNITLSILMLLAFNTAQADKMRLALICEDGSRKVGVTTSSSAFRESDLDVSDEELMKSEDSINAEGIVSYDKSTEKISIDNTMGCVPLTYETAQNSRTGEPLLIWTNLEDNSKGAMKCRWFAYR